MRTIPAIDTNRRRSAARKRRRGERSPLRIGHARRRPRRRPHPDKRQPRRARCARRRGAPHPKPFGVFRCGAGRLVFRARALRKRTRHHERLRRSLPLRSGPHARTGRADSVQPLRQRRAQHARAAGRCRPGPVVCPRRELGRRKRHDGRAFRDGHLGIGSHLSREQLALVVARAAKADLAAADPSAFNALPDHGAASPWARDALVWATDEGVINGDTGTNPPRILPQSPITRAQMAQVAMNAMAGGIH